MHTDPGFLILVNITGITGREGNGKNNRIWKATMRKKQKSDVACTILAFSWFLVLVKDEIKSMDGR